ncbi:DoxX family protein [Cellulomonas sp. PhB150]|uniref:DoxX family protein n=1 Tax=Cellulomonas sp. PhB150 TaxID=2485188 RepID=UPI001F353D5C|nr:DoxX family protein [Cellulomonas sp. PhB150]
MEVKMTVAYWIVAGLLALTYLASGGIKIVLPAEKLLAMWPWTGDLRLRTVRLIGTLEVLGALGLVLPRLTGIAEWLSVVAAVGLVVVPLGGLALHVRRGEGSQTVPNVVLAVLAAVAAWLGAATL